MTTTRLLSLLYLLYLLYLQSFAASLSLSKKSTPLFSSNSSLFLQNTRGGGIPLPLKDKTLKAKTPSRLISATRCQHVPSAGHQCDLPRGSSYSLSSGDPGAAGTRATHKLSAGREESVEDPCGIWSVERLQAVADVLQKGIKFHLRGATMLHLERMNFAQDTRARGKKQFASSAENEKLGALNIDLQEIQSDQTRFAELVDSHREHFDLGGRCWPLGIKHFDVLAAERRGHASSIRVKGNETFRIGYDGFDDLDALLPVVQENILAESSRRLCGRLKGKDAALSADAQRSGESEKTEVRTDVRHFHTRPNLFHKSAVKHGLVGALVFTVIASTEGIVEPEDVTVDACLEAAILRSARESSLPNRLDPLPQPGLAAKEG